MVCGSSTTNLGHNHPAHIAAIDEVAATGILHTGTRLPSPFRADLYELLAGILPDGLGCFQLVNSGAEAVEAAIKAAQFVTGRHRLLSFEGGYHGRTLGALSVTHGERIRKPFSVLEGNVDFLPYPYLDDPVGPGKSARECLGALSDRLSELQTANELPAALLFEPIQGVGGVVVPPEEFTKGVRDLTRDFGVLLICDEIWSGFGRTGRWFSFDHTGIAPDIVTIGKALSGGLPLSAAAAGEHILKAWPPGMHTSTFQGNPVACSMACATIRTIGEDALLNHIASVIEPELQRTLAPLSEAQRVHAVRVNGAQAAVELVTKTGQPDADAVMRLQRSALEQHIMIYAGGWHGNAVMFVPTINIDQGLLADGLAAVVKLIEQEVSG
jgi:4-aminobutyrate aminotransferase